MDDVQSRFNHLEVVQMKSQGADPASMSSLRLLG